jgi:serine/alanine adding enzyme
LAINVGLHHDETSWEAYVSGRDAALNYHHWSWRKVIEDTYGHRPLYLAAMEDGRVEGVLPLFRIKSLLFGSSLVSVPFSSYGGILASNTEVRERLGEEAVRLARETGARHIETRDGGEGAAGWVDTTPKVTMVVDLPDDLKSLWEDLNAKVRKRVRFGLKNGLTTECLSGAEAVAEFYEIFAVNMRNLGTPVYPREWFENIVKYHPDAVRVLMVRDEGRPSAAAFLVCYRDTVEMPWAASLEDGRKKFSPLLMYWSVIEWAFANGYRHVDLGRCTPGSGNYEFKQHWRPVERPLHWRYWMSKGDRVPAVKREDSRFAMAVEVWKRLPLSVANSLGPLVVRSIP